MQLDTRICASWMIAAYAHVHYEVIPCMQSPHHECKHASQLRQGIENGGHGDSGRQDTPQCVHLSFPAHGEHTQHIRALVLLASAHSLIWASPCATDLVLLRFTPRIHLDDPHACQELAHQLHTHIAVGQSTLAPELHLPYA